MKKEFLVCSDCAYFEETELIDERYPMIKRGKCIKHNKTVDNRWETDCKDNTYYCCCDQCEYFHENKYFDPDEFMDDMNSEYSCEKHYVPVEETSKVCKNFKYFYKK